MSRRIKRSAIWLVPIILIAGSLAFHALVRAFMPGKEQDFEYGTIPFVPGESNHATGRDSR